MRHTSRQTIVSPEVIGPQQVFTINDIELVIPPTSIVIRQEDLTYTWRTLRTKVATKIPSGHGNIQVHVSIPFTGDQMLVLHRLIVEFRQSPFCYVDNRYLRESIVPDWPWTQNMAFTMTGLNIHPMRGSSDTWICELDLTWFNYFPYTHNYLFRDDWRTNWIKDDADGLGSAYSYSIGWELDRVSYEKLHRRSVLYTTRNNKETGKRAFIDNKSGRFITSNSLAPSLPELPDVAEYSPSSYDYQSSEAITIADLEVNHPGAEFDLLPLPDNMVPAIFVSEPKRSRIYVRYINYLQRDALYKNFGIDAELDMQRYEESVYASFNARPEKEREAFFNDYVLKPTRQDFWGQRIIDNRPRTFSLASARLPQSIRDRWIHEMIKHHSGVRFHFHVYKEIELPKKWTERSRAGQATKIQQFIRELGLGTALAPAAQFIWPLAIEPNRQYATSFFGLRKSPHVKDETSNHTAIDLHAPTGTLVVAPASGIVRSIVNDDSSRVCGNSIVIEHHDRLRTSYCHLLEVLVKPGQPVSVGEQIAYSGGGANDVGRGNSQSAHLHFEVQEKRGNNWVRVDPGPYLGMRAYRRSPGSEPDGDVLPPSLYKPPGSDDLSTQQSFPEVVVNDPPSSVDWSIYFDKHGQLAKREEFETQLKDIYGYGDDVIIQVEPTSFTEEPIISILSAKHEPLVRFIPLHQLPVVPVERAEAPVEEIPELDAVSIDEENEGIDSETSAVKQLLEVLDADGWRYYDKDDQILNVWHKLISIRIDNSGYAEILRQQDAPEFFIQHGIVLTNVSGGLAHIVSRIPILSHEYPTQQHLGSIEPMYQMEFAVLDDQGDLEGISEVAQYVQGMRAVLQKNARQLRQIPDGWCVATDTFITRILGTYENNDFLIERKKLPDGTEQVVDYEISKRAAIARSTAGTVEGNPGLSFITLDLEETNVYRQEALKSTAPKLEVKKEHRQKVLQTLSNYKLSDKYQQLLYLTLATGGDIDNLLDVSSDTYAKLTLPFINSLDQLKFAASDQVVLRGENLGGDYLLVRKETAEFNLSEEFFAAKNYETVGVGREGESYTSNKKSDRHATYWYKVPLADIGIYQEGRVWDRPKPQVIDADIRYSGYGGVLDDAETSTSKHNKVTYDLQDLIEGNPEFSDIPIVQIKHYQDALFAIIAQAEHILAEEEAGGLTRREISERLYNLNTKAFMWQHWQCFVRKYVSEATVFTVGKTQYANPLSSYKPTDAVNHLEKVPNWNGPGGALWSEKFTDTVKRAEIEKNAEQLAHSIGAQAMASNTTGLLQWFYDVGRQVGVGVSATDLVEERNKSAVETLVTHYMSNQPLQFKLGEAAKNIIGKALGSLIGEDIAQFPKPLQNMFNTLGENLNSCGNFVFNPAFTFTGSLNAPVYAYEDKTLNAGVRSFLITIPEIDLGWANSYSSTIKSLELEPGNTAAGKQLHFHEYRKNYSQQLLSSTPRVAYNITSASIKKATAANFKPPSRPFLYPTDLDQENYKLAWLEDLLSSLADRILYDAPVLEELGLMELIITGALDNVVGSECYPDLDLPTHPFYGTTFEVYPDFYMWNIYEDGGALGPGDLAEIQKNVHAVVERSYLSMKKMQNGQSWEQGSGDFIGDTPLDQHNPLNQVTQITPEGTDYLPKDPGYEKKEGKFKPVLKESRSASSCPFAPVPGTEDLRIGERIDSLWQKKAKDEKEYRQMAKTALRDSVQSQGGENVAGRPRNFAPKISLDPTEKFGGAGGGVHYPLRADRQVYLEMKTKIANIESMFGSRAGFLKQYPDKENTPEIANAIEGTKVQRPLAYAHAFDPGTLKQLSDDSGKDLLSRKMTLRRAFPTFKLFFVEEDVQEDRLLSFDDFHSYNAVKSFTAVLSRKMPADHAVIVLQNVSGTLDGTRRNLITDLDYSDNTAAKKIAGGAGGPGASAKTNPTVRDTAQEQPFGAVVLRPGMNIQLRCGYSNDPENLHVLISGRVTDLAWNQQGDLAEITVQSFGTELIQAIKGTSRSLNDEAYPTTHHLLGSMMLSPELEHFGRWKFGQTFQVGEGSDARLDIEDYSKQGFLGTLSRTTDWARWTYHHPGTIAAITLGIEAGLWLFPFGRAFKGLSILSKSRLGARALAGHGLPGLRSFTTARGAGGLRAAFTKGVSASKVKSGALSKTDLKNLNKIFREEIAGVLRPAASSLDKAGKKVLGKNHGKFFKETATTADLTFEQYLKMATKHEGYLNGVARKGRWMNKPWLTTADNVQFLTGIGFTTPAAAYIRKAGKVAVGIAATGFVIEAASEILGSSAELLGLDLLNKTKNFFKRAKAHLMLSPQDDNLYPPHPRDYMTEQKGIVDSIAEGTAEVGDTLGYLIGFPGLGETLQYWWNPGISISKRVDPDACIYVPVTTNIWNIFHEMTLRHPGWIYGPRPYGTKFQYTMFFGPPAQRYWAVEGSPMFVHRVNKLRRYLRGKNEFSISESEFKALYGGKRQLEIKTMIQEMVGKEVLPFDDRIAKRERFEKALNEQYTSIAMKEYLRALELRFIPFRRYHMFTSDQDIVWNGIMGSERSVVNAVDVTYLVEKRPPEDASKAGGAVDEIKTAVFKAHSFIPQHLLKIAPIRYPNCRSYQMAMRYGMGELMHRMKDMYRGELIVLGNMRVRPWDIGIVVDTYNDMVGPIEVEQVVHNFSHETGLITEIKPSAVVFGNEISGWPLATAMQLFAMAVRDIQERHTGVAPQRGEPQTFLGTLAYAASQSWLPHPIASGVNMVADATLRDPNIPGGQRKRAQEVFGKDSKLFGNRLFDAEDQSYESFMSDKYGRTFGGSGADLYSVLDEFGLTGDERVAALDNLVQLSQKGLTAGGGAFGASVAITGNLIGNALLNKGSIKFTKGSLLAIGMGGLVGGMAGSSAGAAIARNIPNFPSLAWLMGGPVLFLQCLRNDAVIVLPLIKNGHPVIAGLAYNNPTMLWKNFRGNLERYLEDTLTGTTDMIGLYRQYGSELWRRSGDLTLNNWITDTDFVDMTGTGVNKRLDKTVR